MEHWTKPLSKRKDNLMNERNCLQNHVQYGVSIIIYEELIKLNNTSQNDPIKNWVGDMNRSVFQSRYIHGQPTDEKMFR